MQDGQEDSVGFVKSIKNKVHVHDWWVSFESRHLWTARLVVYFTCLAVVISVCFILFYYFNLFHTDASSARYMLSALVQSQAAIVAIVITLTLIAVQLTASTYSPRVIDIFKKNPDMWILLGCYGTSIFYGFIVLKLVEGTEGEAVGQSAIWSLGQVSISLESYVSITYWLGAFTFIALFPYMLDVIRLLKPENIIERLAIRITKGKILNHINSAKTSEGAKIRTVDDPIQPIMDIIHGSIMKYDLETTRVGLKAVTDRVIIIFLNEEAVQQSKIGRKRKANRALSPKRSKIFGVKSNYETASKTEIIDSDSEKKISEDFCKHLERVGRLAMSKLDEESAIEVIENFENFWKSAAKRKLKDATRYAVRSLGEIGKAAAEKELEEATREAVISLREIGKAAAEKELEDATEEVVWSLRAIGKADAEKELKEATRYAAWSLGEVGKAAAEKGLKDATERAAEELGEVGKAAAEKKLENATREAVRSLGEIGKAAAEKELEDATEEAVRSLGEVGRTAAEKCLEGATWRVVESLVEVGKAAVKNDLEDATKRAAESLAELAILKGDKTINTAIKNYKSPSVTQDRKSFKKFMEKCKQELKKKKNMRQWNSGNSIDIKAG